MIDNQLNRQASELVSFRKRKIFSTQLSPRRKISILNRIRLDEAKKFNNVEKPIEEVCILDDYLKFLDKVIRVHLATHRSRREQVESYCKDDCNNDETIEEVIHVHEEYKFDDDSLCLDDLFRDDLVIYTPTEEKIESCANLMMILYVWMTCLEMIWLHTHPPRRKLNHIVRMYA